MRRVFFKEGKNKIDFSDKVNSFSIRDFCSALRMFKKNGGNNLILDFTKVTHAYPNGMVGVISAVERLKSEGVKVETFLPDKYDVRKLFRSVNWAYMLCPEKYYPTESEHDRHLIIKSFDDPNRQKKVVDEFMDVVLRSISVSKDVISGIEWSINEITDNVLNHSNSSIGGFVQASTFPKNNTIAFAVADSGRGILKSLKEGIPTLRTDVQAIGEAMKAGVTRDKKFGQGNGLAGTARVTTLTGGSFEITSGTARVLTTNEETRRNLRHNDQSYVGTIVCGQIINNKEFSIVDALDFGQQNNYQRVDFLETQYELEDKDCYLLKMKEETTGFGSRFSGRQLRTKLLNLLNSNNTYPIIIDWEGIPVISSSFADEFIGKLFLEIGVIAFSSRVRFRAMEDLIRNLIDKAVGQRLTAAKDDE